jgi:hypothetical protein
MAGLSELYRRTGCAGGSGSYVACFGSCSQLSCYGILLPTAHPQPTAHSHSRHTEISTLQTTDYRTHSPQHPDQGMCTGVRDLLQAIDSAYLWHIYTRARGRQTQFFFLRTPRVHLLKPRTTHQPTPPPLVFLLVHFWAFLGKGSSKTPQIIFVK